MQSLCSQHVHVLWSRHYLVDCKLVHIPILGGSFDCIRVSVRLVFLQPSDEVVHGVYETVSMLSLYDIY